MQFILLLHPVIRASLWTLGMVLSFTLMAVAGREMTHELSTFQILFFRTLVALSVVSLLLCHHGWPQVRTQRFGMHFVRNLSHFSGQFGWFYAIAFIPLAEVFALEFTMPVWAVLFAALLLGEKLTRARVGAVALGLLGMLVILRPGIAAINLAAVAVLLGAATYSFAYILTKKLVSTESSLCILFYMNLVQLGLAIGPTLATWVTPSMSAWPWLLAIGVTALTAHYCLTRAMRLADAMLVVPMDFLRLPLVAVVAYLMYDERADWQVFAGAALIVIGNLMNVRAEQRRTTRV